MAKIPLKKPLTHDGTTLSEIEIREPELADLIAFEDITETGFKLILAQVVILSGLPEETVRRLGARDLKQINDLMDSFGGNDAAAAGGSSPSSSAA